MSISAISRVSAGVPDGGRFASTGHSEADDELDAGPDGVMCGVCGEPSDQDEGIPCDGCLEDHCACGASLDDGDGYDGQCGSCADLSDPAEEDGPPTPSNGLPAAGFMSEDEARALAAANPKPKGPHPITDADKEIATTIYRQIGPIVAGNMDAKARNAYAVTNGVRMASCRAGARKRVDVTVTLNGCDLYDIEVVSSPTLKADSKPIAKAGNVHVSRLQGLMLKIGDGRPEEIAA